MQQQDCLENHKRKNEKNRRNEKIEKKQRKSIRETCPHFQCGTRQSLVFEWVHQILVLAQFCDSKKGALAQVCDTFFESLSRICDTLFVTKFSCASAVKFQFLTSRSGKENSSFS